eukprot:44058-Eustigmatos_ZCMA.PRE.1
MRSVRSRSRSPRDQHLDRSLTINHRRGQETHGRPVHRPTGQAHKSPRERSQDRLNATGNRARGRGQERHNVAANRTRGR